MSSSTIWKFTERVDDSVEVRMPATLVRWLHVAAEGNAHITLWAEVEPHERLRGYLPHTWARVWVRGTGHPMTGDEGTHIGTVTTPDGLVWHVFADDADIEVGDEE